MIPILVTLLGSEADAQSKPDGVLPNQDVIESPISAGGEWTTRVADTPTEPASVLRARSAALEYLLGKARTDLEAIKAELADERRTAAGERAKNTALQQNFSALRKEIDALRNGAQAIEDARQESLRRELAAARKELDDLHHAEGAARTRARADAGLAVMQRQALEDERERAEGLAGELAKAKLEVGRLKAEATREAADIAQKTQRALDQKRRELWLLTHGRSQHLQSIGAPETGAAETSLQVGTEIAAKQAAKELARLRQRVESAARDFETARQERDAAKAELARVSAALQQERRKAADLAQARKSAESVAGDLVAARQERDAAQAEVARVSAALQQERGKSAALARGLEAARGEIDALSDAAASRGTTIENTPKARTVTRAKARPTASAKVAKKSGASETVGTRASKPPPSLRLTIIELPAALLPTRPSIEELQ